jgi:hypothetical protein
MAPLREKSTELRNSYIVTKVTSLRALLNLCVLRGYA